MTRNVFAFVLLSVLVALTGCGSEHGGSTGPSTVLTSAATAPTTTTVLSPAEDTAAVLTVEWTGGCWMGGPNCSRYVLYGDGSFELFRLDGQEPLELEASGTIDQSLATMVNEVASGTDLAALRDRLPPGYCAGCVDGIDTTLIFGDGESGASFSSVTFELDRTEPVFAAAFAALGEMSSSQSLSFIF